jgi:hypothetical protein
MKKWMLGVAVLFGMVFISPTAPAQSPPPFRIGLNFAFIGGSNAATVAGVFTNITPLGLRGTRHSNPGDVNWLHIHPSISTYDFTNTDLIFFNTNGVMPIGTFYEDPNATNILNPGLQVPWLAGSGFSFTTNELVQASNYVTTVVAHYTNATHLWEIANEVSGITNRPRSLPPETFAGFLVTNRNWIRAVDPQAQVLLPGCLGGYGLPFTNNYIWLRQLLTSLNELGATGFDVMNYHDYKSWWVLPVDFDGYRAVLAEFNLTNMPIWITECSSASTNNPVNPNTVVPYASEDQQAADVWRRSCLLFGKGASVWFWHSLYSDPFGNFANQGLLTPNSGTVQKKKSWHAFKLLVEKIEGFQSASILQLGVVSTNNLNGGGGQWAVQFDCRDGLRRYVVWSGTNLNYTLTNLDTNAAPYRITTVVPASLASGGETATFTVVTNALAGSSLALTGTNLPVLVESTLSPFQIWANTRIPDAAQRGETSDADNDGQNNYAEFLAGTDPNNSASALRVTGISPEGAGWRVYWTSESNKVYTVERASSWPTFLPAQTNLSATAPQNSWLDTNASTASLFYRIRLE